MHGPKSFDTTSYPSSSYHPCSISILQPTETNSILSACFLLATLRNGSTRLLKARLLRTPVRHPCSESHHHLVGIANWMAWKVQVVV